MLSLSLVTIRPCPNPFKKKPGKWEIEMKTIQPQPNPTQPMDAFTHKNQPFEPPICLLPCQNPSTGFIMLVHNP